MLLTFLNLTFDVGKLPEVDDNSTLEAIALLRIMT